MPSNTCPAPSKQEKIDVIQDEEMVRRQQYEKVKTQVEAAIAALAEEQTVTAAKIAVTEAALAQAKARAVAAWLAKVRAVTAAEATGEADNGYDGGRGKDHRSR